MNDDKKPNPAGGTAGKPGAPAAAPNRDRPRDAPVIDARPGDVQEIKQEAKKEANPTGPIAALAAKGNPAGSASASPSASRQSSPNPADQKPAASGLTAGPTGSGSATGAAPGKGWASPAAAASSSAAKVADKTSSIATDKTAAAARQAPAKPPGSPNGGGGFGKSAVAGLAGAVIALAGAWSWQASRGADPGIAALADKIKNNETALAAIKKAAGGGVNAMESVKAMEKRIVALEAAAKQQAAITSTLKGGFEKITAKPAPDSGGLAKLETRIAALEKLTKEAKTSVRATADPVARKPDANEAGKPAGQPVQDTGPSVAKLESRLLDLEKKIKPPVDLGPVNKRIADLSKKVEPLEKQLIGKVDTKIAPISAALAKSTAEISSNAKQIKAAGDTATASIARSNAAATAIVARTLLERITAGKPFDGLVTAMTAMGAKPEHTDLLKPMAEKGVPAKAALVASFKALEKKLLTPETPKGDVPLVERLKQGAFSLVKVRPVGKTESSSPGGLFTRIIAALTAGEYNEALSLYEKFPEKPRAAASAWADELKSRIKAEAAGQAILSSALKQLQQQKS